MRTPEQIKADDELGAAIDKCHRAYNLLLPGMVRQEYMVIVASVAMQEQEDDEGPDETIDMLFENGRIRSSTAEGMMLQAGRQFHEQTKMED